MLMLNWKYYYSQLLVHKSGLNLTNNIRYSINIDLMTYIVKIHLSKKLYLNE